MSEAGKIQTSNNQPLRWIWLIALLAFPIFLWIVPGDYFDEGKVILCPSRFLFDLECFGCGITRGVMNMHHFDFENALFHNKLSPIIYLGLVVIWFIWVKDNLTSLGLLKKKTA